MIKEAKMDETEREMLTVIMLKDVLDGIEHYYGKEGLEQVAHFVTMQNRSRESNRVMDALELLYGPFPTPQESKT
jgi:hypothetical protein